MIILSTNENQFSAILGCSATSDNKDTQCTLHQVYTVWTSAEPFLLLFRRIYIYSKDKTISLKSIKSSPTTGVIMLRTVVLVTSHESMNWHFYLYCLTGSKYYDNYKSVVLLLKNWHALVHQQNWYQILNLILACMLVFKKPSTERMHIRMWLPYLTWQYIMLKWNKITMTLNKMLKMSYDGKYGLIKKSLYVSLQCYQWL